jgi:outer membrane protein TolC
MIRVLIARRDLTAARARRLDLVEAAWSAYAELASIRGALP